MNSLMFNSSNKMDVYSIIAVIVDISGIVAILMKMGTLLQIGWGPLQKAMNYTEKNKKPSIST